MKDYFTRLFQYDLYANQLILKAIRSAGNPQQSILLFGHLLAAQQRWLARCEYSTAPEVEIFPKAETIPFEEVLADNHKRWIAYLSVIGDFDKTITYKTSTGIEFSDKLVDMITQVTNHGTHHRAQIGQQLKLAGIERLPATDYIHFIRN